MSVPGPTTQKDRDPFAPKVFIDVDGLGEYVPQPDITAYELSQLMTFFLIMNSRHGAPFCYPGTTRQWLKERNLERHFQQCQVPPPQFPPMPRQ